MHDDYYEIAVYWDDQPGDNCYTAFAYKGEALMTNEVAVGTGLTRASALMNLASKMKEV